MNCNEGHINNPNIYYPFLNGRRNRFQYAPCRSSYHNYCAAGKMTSDIFMFWLSGEICYIYYNIEFNLITTVINVVIHYPKRIFNVTVRAFNPFLRSL